MASTMRAAVTVNDDNGKQHFEVAQKAIPTPQAGEILIRVEVAGVNRIDMIMARGAMGPIDIVGMEVSGTVHAVGEGCQNFALGDNVFALLDQGGYAEYVCAREGLAMKVPEGASLEQAAAVPETWLTAYQLLNRVGNLERGHTVLVHAAGSGVGIALIQLAREMGATVFATAGTQEKLENAKRLGAKAAYNYKEEEFGEKVLEHTNNKGVDLIFDCVGGGAHAVQNAKALAMDGQWVLYGLLGGLELPPNFLRLLLSKRAALKATTLRTRSSKYKEDLVADFQREILPRMSLDGGGVNSSSVYEIVADKIFPLDEVNEAHLYMKESKNLGKILLRVSTA